MLINQQLSDIKKLIMMQVSPYPYMNNSIYHFTISQMDENAKKQQEEMDQKVKPFFIQSHLLSTSIIA